MQKRVKNPLFGKIINKLYFLFKKKEPSINYTPKRVLNKFLNKVSRFLKISRVWGYPENLFIEPTNLYNLRCPLCPTGNGRLKRKKGKMSFVNFKKIIDELADYSSFIGLTNYGEPFMNKEILRMISYAKKKGLIVSVVTNGHFIGEKELSEMIKCYLDQIVISLDGATPETYKQYRVGGDFSKVKKAIERLVEEKSKTGSRFPHIEVQFLVMKQNEKEIDKFKEMVKELKVDKFFFKVTTPFSYGYIQNAEEVKSYLPENPSYCPFEIKNGYLFWKREEKYKNWCDMAWSFPAVNWDGTLSPCCYDYNGIFTLGNVFEKGFKKAWKSRNFVSFRKKILKNRKEIPLCANCPVNFYEDLFLNI